MSMEHKAYVFDYDSFMIQLSPTLVDALKNNNKDNLINFIQRNIENLRDPDDILTVDEVWQNIKQDGDIDKLGDLALTKFYNPSEDIGLNYEWWNVEKILKTANTLDSNTIHLGRCIVSGNNCFNPGKLGSYFQSPKQVKDNLRAIDEYLRHHPEKLPVLLDLTTMLSIPSSNKKGLYITF